MAIQASLRQRRQQPMPPPLRGTYASLVRQNEKTEDEGLDRIDDDDELAALIRHRQLVPVPISASLAINSDLPDQRRYCRPWTAAFLADLAAAHQRRFRHGLQVTSAVRTVEYQKQLAQTNGNAAAAEGDVVSPHLTGAAIDIAKNGMTREEVGWMRAWLLPLQNAGKLDVEEEFQQACFHITVYKSYVPARPATRPQQPSTVRHKNAAPTPVRPLPALPSGELGEQASGAE